MLLEASRALYGCFCRLNSAPLTMLPLKGADAHLLPSKMYLQYTLEASTPLLLLQSRLTAPPRRCLTSGESRSPSPGPLAPPLPSARLSTSSSAPGRTYQRSGDQQPSFSSCAADSRSVWSWGGSSLCKLSHWRPPFQPRKAICVAPDTISLLAPNSTSTCAATTLTARRAERSETPSIATSRRRGCNEEVEGWSERCVDWIAGNGNRPRP